MKIESTERICVLRSAFLGDWITAIPFLIYLIDECGIKKENIYNVVINNKGLNPVKMVLGPQSILGVNSYTIKSSSIGSSIRSAKAIKKCIDGNIDRIIFLPFTNESAFSTFKKYLISFFLASYRVRREGFHFKDKLLFNLPVSQYVSYFTKMGIEYTLNFEQGRQFLVSESIKINQKQLETVKRIGVYANSKLKMKIWPKENYIKVIENIANQVEAEFFLIGAQEDFEYNEQLMAGVSKDVKINNLSGKLSIPETFMLLSKTDLLLSNDAAPIHFASLVNIPVVGLYTYKEPIGAWDPYLSENYTTFRTEVLCKNCFKEECINPVCITMIPFEVVEFACMEILSKCKHPYRENRVLIPHKPISYRDSISC